MENESRKKLDSKTRPFAGLIGCHEEKREAYTRLYKRQVMSFVRVIFSKPVIIKKKKIGKMKYSIRTIKRNEEKICPVVRPIQDRILMLPRAYVFKTKLIFTK